MEEHELFKDEVGLARHLAARTKEIEARREPLAALLRTAALLRRRGYIEKDALPKGGPVRQKLERLAEKVERNQPLTSGKDYLGLLGSIDSLNRELTIVTSEAWAVVRLAEPEINSTLVEAIAQIPGQSEVADRLQKAATRLERAVSEEPPRSEEQWNHYEESVQLAKKAREEMDEERFPRPVMRFFQAAQAANGAQFSLLTEEVKAWLGERGLMDKLRIRI